MTLPLISICRSFFDPRGTGVTLSGHVCGCFFILSNSAFSIFCPAIILRGTPLGCDRAFLLQLQQHGIQSPLIHRQQISADLFDAPRDAVAVLRSQDIQSLEDHQRQRAL